MAGTGTGTAGVSSPVWASFHSRTAYASSARYSCATSGNFSVLCRSQISYLSSKILVGQRTGITQTHLSLKASSTIAADGRCEFIEEPGTSVKFQTLVSLPGCSSPLTLLGTGYREKVFAIIGVKVYAAGLYVNNSILSKLSSWSGQSGIDIQNNQALFNSFYEDPLEKSLQIVLVRDVDGKTFWDALNDAISPRIKAPSLADESALTTFRATFEGRPLKKGTFIFLTWLEPSKMLVSISSEGLPSAVDATVESKNVTAALFDVFLGNGPVSPTLKASVANGLASMLN